MKEEIPNRLLPRAIFEPTDNSVVLTITNREGVIVSQNSFNKTKEAYDYYETILNEFLADAQKQIEKAKKND